MHTLRNQFAHALLTFTLPPRTPLTAYDHPIANINYTSHYYLSDIPMPVLTAPTTSSFPILDEGDLDQGDDVVYLATHSTHNAPYPLPCAPHRVSPHPMPNFDLCAKFPP